MPVVRAVAGYCLKMALKDVTAQSKHYIVCKLVGEKSNPFGDDKVIVCLFLICRSVGGYSDFTLQGGSVEGG